MNPFSAFLTPPSSKPLDLSGVDEIIAQRRNRRLDDRHNLENDRSYELEQQNAKRSDAFLKVQQDDQAHRFSKDDKAEVEGLLAEYQDAVKRKDDVAIGQSIQKLKRFGMDVQEGGPATPASKVPNLRAFNGSSLGGPLPDVAPARDEELNEPAGPEEPDLSQGDFEKQLIDGSQSSPGRYEQNGKTTEEYKKLLPQSPDEPEDLGDVDDPAFKAAAQEDIGGQEPLPRLATQHLPNVISKGGKKLYEDVPGGKGSYGPMVGAVFEPYTQHSDPRIAQAAKRAQETASNLMSVEGISTKQAIDFAANQFKEETGGFNKLDLKQIGAKAHLGGGGGGAPGKFQALGPKEDRAESIKGYITESRGAVGKLNESDRLLAQAEALANSPDPALQRNAVDVLVQSRSGATVSERERARYDQLDGMITGLTNYLSRLGGGAVDAEYMKKIKMVIAEQRRINSVTRDEVASDLEEAYAAQNEGKVDAPILQRRKTALGKTIRRDNAGASPNGYDPELDQ
jgi:uncharacterized protein YoaH (UPF0181 family)